MREKLAKNLFSFAFFVWYLTEILFSTKLEYILNDILKNVFGLEKADIGSFFNVLIFMLLIVVIFIQQYTFREIMLITLIAVPVSISTVLSDNRFMMSFLLFAIAAKYVNLDNVIRQGWYILSAALIFVVMLCYFGVLPDVLMYRHNIVRHSLGFEHPNSLGIVIFQWTTCFCYCVGEKINSLLLYMILLLCAFFSYKVPNSQTSYVGILILFIVVLLGKIICKKEKVTNSFMLCMGIGIGLLNIGSIALGMTEHGKGTIFKSIDKVLSYRFTYCNIMHQYYKVTLFGQKVVTLVKDKRYVDVYRQLHLDNAYFSILLTFGLIVYLLFLVIQITMVFYYIKLRNLMMVSILFVNAIYGVMETGYYTLSHNIFLMAFTYALYKRMPENNNTDKKIVISLGRKANLLMLKG